MNYQNEPYISMYTLAVWWKEWTCTSIAILSNKVEMEASRGAGARQVFDSIPTREIFNILISLLLLKKQSAALSDGTHSKLGRKWGKRKCLWSGLEGIISIKSNKKTNILNLIQIWLQILDRFKNYRQIVYIFLSQNLRY